ncbi:MAG TPA: SDR family NAD(P)-dependent oxidoreductase [Ferruginibacter sp.]|nr:SDR family NAD(P)-dependent oxidoreductase [Ferruginibacter sp.]
MKNISILLFIVFSITSVNAQTATDNASILANIFLPGAGGPWDKKIQEFMIEPETSKKSPENTSAYALVAGGSKGIGFAIAEALAKRKYNLILIARNWDTLNIAKNKLESAYGVHVELLSYDLSKEESATRIAKWCSDKNIPLKMLFNVAGLGGDEDYLELSLDSVRYMVRLNVESAMALSLTLLPLLEKNAPSYILNVASMAGLGPIPAKNVYSATKAAVVSFSYSLRYQLKGKNISVSCLAPGPVYTKPSIKANTKKQLGWFGDQLSVSPKKVGEICVRKTLKGRMLIVPGTLARIMSGVLRILPRRWVTYIYYQAGGSGGSKK